jgi:hypothetical protein
LVQNTAGLRGGKIWVEGWVWRTPVIPTLGRQKDHKFKANLSYIARYCPPKKGFKHVFLLSHSASSIFWQQELQL